MCAWGTRPARCSNALRCQRAIALRSRSGDTRLSGYMLEVAGSRIRQPVSMRLWSTDPDAGSRLSDLALCLQAGGDFCPTQPGQYDNGIKFFSAQGAKRCRTMSNTPSKRDQIEQPTVVRRETRVMLELAGRSGWSDARGPQHRKFRKEHCASQLDLSIPGGLEDRLSIQLRTGRPAMYGTR